MSDHNLLEMYNPLYDVHLRQYFALPHMQKHLRSVGLLDSTVDVRQPAPQQQVNNGPLPPMSSGGGADNEMYARHHAMMDMMLRNRDRVLAQLADLQKKLDAVEKVELYRSIKSGVTNVDEWRRSRMSRSLSRPSRASGGPNSRMRRRPISGERQRRLSNSMAPYGDDDKELVKRIEAERAAGVRTPRSIFERLAASVYRYQYLHKLDDRTLENYKHSLGKQLQKLERFRELSFGPHSVARHQPANLPQSWFFRRRSLPSLTASAPANSLQQPLARSLKAIKKGGSGQHVRDRQGGRSQSPRWRNANADIGINGSANNARQRSSRPAAAHAGRLPPLPRAGKAETADKRAAAAKLPPTAVIRPTRKEKQQQPIRRASPPTSIKSGGEDGREGSERGGGSALPTIAAVGVAGLAAGAVLGAAASRGGDGVTPPAVADQSGSPVDENGGEMERDADEEESGGGGTETRPSPEPFLEPDHHRLGDDEEDVGSFTEQPSPRHEVEEAARDAEEEEEHRDPELEERHEELGAAAPQELEDEGRKELQEEELAADEGREEAPEEFASEDESGEHGHHEETRSDANRVESSTGTEAHAELAERGEPGGIETTPRLDEAPIAGEEERHENLASPNEETHQGSERGSEVHDEEGRGYTAMGVEEPINVAYTEPLAAERDEVETTHGDTDHGAQLFHNEAEEQQPSPQPMRHEMTGGGDGHMEEVEGVDGLEDGVHSHHSPMHFAGEHEEQHSPEPESHENEDVGVDADEPEVHRVLAHGLENRPISPPQSGRSAESQAYGADVDNHVAHGGDEHFKEISLGSAGVDEDNVHEDEESHRSARGASLVEEHGEAPLSHHEAYTDNAGYEEVGGAAKENDDMHEDEESHRSARDASVVEEHGEVPLHPYPDEDYTNNATPGANSDGARNNDQGHGNSDNPEPVDHDDDDNHHPMPPADDVEEPFELRNHSPLTVGGEQHDAEEAPDQKHDENDDDRHYSPAAVSPHPADVASIVSRGLYDGLRDNGEEGDAHIVTGNNTFVDSPVHASGIVDYERHDSLQSHGSHHVDRDEADEAGSVQHQASPLATPRSPSYAEVVATARSPSPIAQSPVGGNGLEQASGVAGARNLLRPQPSIEITPASPYQDHSDVLVAEDEAVVEPVREPEELLHHDQGLENGKDEEENKDEEEERQSARSTELNGTRNTNGHHHNHEEGDSDERTSLLSAHNNPLHFPNEDEEEEHVDNEEGSENGSVIINKEGEHAEGGADGSEKRNSLGELKHANRNSIGNAEEAGDA